MPKKYRSYSKKRVNARRRRYGKKKTIGAKIGRSMQNKSLSYVKKKYTVVIPIQCDAGQNLTQFTISHIGGVNTNAPVPATLTLKDCNPDGMASSDMDLYQFFRITGVSFKLFFPEGTDPSHTPVQWAMAYSSNQIVLPNVDFNRLQTLQNYQTSSCDSSKPVARYFKTAGTMRRLGIDWCPTSDYPFFNPVIPSSQQDLYNGQLPPNSGSSTNIKVYRARGAPDDAEIARVQLTYYVTYKGAKGVNSLVAP